jgi:CRP-like cAMP-binding protein
VYEGVAMFIKQSDLLLGTSMDFVKKIMDISRMVSHEKGAILFHENDESRYFYILLNGHVRLRVGDSGQVVYDVGQNGEAFGWSSLIGRDVYSASAECVEPTKLLVTDRKELAKILEEDPANGIIFVKHLAATLGNRLIETYKIIPPSSE